MNAARLTMQTIAPIITVLIIVQLYFALQSQRLRKHKAQKKQKSLEEWKQQ